MSYAELPLIITEQILRHAILHCQDIAQWKHQLKLISVCRSWRTTGLPLVYRRAYILGASEFGTGISLKGFSKNTAAHSNLGLILDTHNLTHVRTLHIELLHPQYLASLAEKIHGLFGQILWPTVNELTLEMAPDGMSDEDEDDGCNLHVNTEALAQCFRWYMPNIATLNLNVERWFRPGVRLAEHLAYLYAGQLVALSTNRSRVTQGLLFSTNLSALDIFIRPGCILPRIVSSSVVSLKLRDVPSDFCWSHMVAPNPTFDKLQRLEIHYANKFGHTKSQEYFEGSIANFPSLMSLKLSVSSFDQFYTVLCTGLWKMPNVRQLEIRGYGESLINLLGSQYSIDKACAKVVENLPQVQNLLVSGFDDDEECSHLAQLLTLGYANQLQSLQSQYPIDPAGHIFLNLSYLTVSASLGYSLDLVLYSAPSLRTLNLDTLSHGFSWIHFSELWKFPLLETLNIVYDNTAQVDLRQDLVSFAMSKKLATVECPKLKYLSVSGASYTGLRYLLAPGKSCWQEVTRLELELVAFSNVGKVNAETEANLESFGLHICSAIPNVRHLCCSGIGASARFNNAMYKTMVSNYAQNLYSLQCTAPLPLGILPSIENIENLDISISPSYEEKSCGCNIQPQKLQKLQLSNVPADFSWSWLGVPKRFAIDDKDCIEVDCKSLESLSMTLTNVYHSQTKNYKNHSDKRILLNMPKLTSLVLRTLVPNLDIAASVLHLGCIGSVNLYGPVDALPQCGKLNAVTNSIDISITAADENQEFYRLTNSWFGQSGFINCASLKLANLSFALDPCQTNWPQLTQLTLESTIRFETLVALLHSLGSLETLQIGWILADTITNEVAVVESIVYSCSWIAPVSKSLKSLEINALAPGCVEKFVSLGFKYLLLVAPALEKMYAPEDISFSKTNFISQMAQVYPHLSNIIFNDY